LEAARVATPDDLPNVVALAQSLRGELQSQRGGALWLARDARPEPLEPALRALLDRGDARVFVGTIDGTVVGYATVEIEALRDGTRLGMISELFVEEGARAVGVGEALADAIFAFCHAAGCVGIDAFALPGARAAKNFFERSGYTARMLIMHHPL